MRAIFRTTDLAAADLALATAVVSSVLLLDEARKLAARAFVRRPLAQPHHNTQGEQR